MKIMIASQTVIIACGFAALLGPPIAVFGLVMFKGWRRLRDTRSPPDDRSSRKPGEALRKEIKIFDGNHVNYVFRILNFGCACALGSAAYTALCAGSTYFGLKIAILFALLTIATVLMARNMVR